MVVRAKNGKLFRVLITLKGLYSSNWINYWSSSYSHFISRLIINFEWKFWFWHKIHLDLSRSTNTQQMHSWLYEYIFSSSSSFFFEEKEYVSKLVHAQCSKLVNANQKKRQNKEREIKIIIEKIKIKKSYEY